MHFFWPGRRGFLSFFLSFVLFCWSSTSLDFSLSLSVAPPLCELQPLPFCILVCTATLLLGLCVLKKKGNFYLQRVRKSILKKKKEKKRKGLSEAVLSEKNYHSGHMPAHQLRLFSLLHCLPCAFRYFSIKACQPPEQSTLSLRWSQSTVEHPQFFFFSLKWKRRVNSTLLDGPTVTWRCHTGRLTCRAASVHCGAAFQPGCQDPTERSGVTF